MKLNQLFNEWTELTTSEQIEFFDMIKNHTSDKQVPIKTDEYFQEYNVSCTLCNLKLDKVMGYVC